jgi:lipoate-protein ligase A
MEKTWRLIIDGGHEPAMNMAVDEAIMINVAEGHSMPALRIYKWLNPCISVGKFQRINGISLGDLPCGRQKEVVRRPTGGGMVAHGGEGFTYSMIYREGPGCVAKGAAASYSQIHGCVAEAFRSLGADARLYMASSAVSGPSGECFSSPVRSDVILDGRKVAGAAQRRKHGTVLHQGEVSLDLDVFGKWSYNDFQAAFINRLSKQLDLRFLETRVSGQESNLAKELVMERTEEVTR